MLTKNDLDQIGKVVRNIVREEVEAEVKEFKEDVDYELKTLRLELSLRLDKVENKLKDIDIRLTKLEKSTDKLSKDISRIKKDIKSLISYHDEYYVKLRKRVEKIEDHLRI